MDKFEPVHPAVPCRCVRLAPDAAGRSPHVIITPTRLHIYEDGRVLRIGRRRARAVCIDVAPAADELHIRRWIAPGFRWPLDPGTGPLVTSALRAAGWSVQVVAT